MKIGFTDVDAAVVAVSRDIVLIPLTVFVALAAVADAVVVALVVVVALAVVVTPAVVVESLFLPCRSPTCNYCSLHMEKVSSNQ